MASHFARGKHPLKRPAICIPPLPPDEPAPPLAGNIFIAMDVVPTAASGAPPFSYTTTLILTAPGSNRWEATSAMGPPMIFFSAFMEYDDVNHQWVIGWLVALAPNGEIADSFNQSDPVTPNTLPPTPWPTWSPGTTVDFAEATQLFFV